MTIILNFNVIPNNAVLNHNAASNYAFLANYRIEYLRVFSNSRIRSNDTVVANRAFNMSFDILAIVPIKWLNLSNSSVKDR